MKCSIKIRQHSLSYKRYCHSCYTLEYLQNKYNLSHSDSTPIFNEQVSANLPKDSQEQIIGDKNAGISEISMIFSDADSTNSSVALEDRFRPTTDSIILSCTEWSDKVPSQDEDLNVSTHEETSTETDLDRVSSQEGPSEAYETLNIFTRSPGFIIYRVREKITETPYLMKKFSVFPDQEMDIWSSLNHNNISQFISSFSRGNSVYIISEYMDCSLNFILKAIPDFPEEFIVYICREVLLGLDYLHSHNILHRGIKSESILLDMNGNVKIGNLGNAARIVGSEWGRKTLKGSPDWMAPEIVKGHEYNSSVDTWAFGILVIEMAEGNTPYYKQNAINTLAQIASKPSPHLKEYCKWSKELNELVNDCLKKNPEQRPMVRELLEREIFSNIQVTRELFRDFLHTIIKSSE